jgi:uncharacterized protein (DUF362 family)
MDQSEKGASPDRTEEKTSLSGVSHYSSEINRRWEKIHEDMRQIQISGVKGASISEVYANTGARRIIPPDHPLSVVGFSSMTKEPSDEEVSGLVDAAVAQVLGPGGLSAIIKPGDRVVIKVNIVEPSKGLPGEKGRGMISDPRIVRYVAEKVRDIIGFGGNADLKVIDATMVPDKNPSDKENPHSFYYARFQRTGTSDICYDSEGNGILDGKSAAQLVNLDSVQKSDRFLTVIDEPIRGQSEAWLPKFLRTKDQAHGESEYCDVYIGIPIFKSHGFCGMTGALKLHWGTMLGVLEKCEHAGWGWGTGDIRHFLDYLCAMNRARGFDLVIMDALTGNRSGPDNGGKEEDAKADIILTNAVLCSKDPVAIDTVETLLGGYQLDSIPLLESAYRDGIGINKPAYIDLKGFDAFFTHKKWLRETYPGSGPGSYPFMDRWGNARTHDDFNAPVNVMITCLSKSPGSDYLFKYSASEPDPCNHGLARIDFLVNGTVIKRLFDSLSGGRVTVNMENYRHQNIHCRIAAWDNALNCTLSDELEVDVQ